MNRIYTLLVIILLPLCSSGQQLQQVAHLPSTEVYDMLVDKKGFIWIAHNLGVSRYDGISFTSFSNPAQTALSMTDLVEDNYGRIWCHNFNGQIFYIKDDKMVYLEEYDFKKEHTFPRIVLYGDNLVATSAKGLFICNTATLKCRYITLDSSRLPTFRGTTSLCAINNIILAYGYAKWYTYTKSTGLNLLIPADTQFTATLSTAAVLQPHAYHENAFLMDEKAGLLYYMSFKNKSLQVTFTKELHTYINTTSILDEDVWINTRTGSFCLNKNEKLDGYNISAQTYDREGNKWVSSLTYGLLVLYKKAGWKMIEPLKITTNDYIEYIKRICGQFVIASQYGKLAISTLSPGSNTNSTFTIPPLPKNGTIENVQSADDKSCFIETSGNLYLLNVSSKHLYFIDSTFVTKDVFLNGTKAYIAAGTGLLIKDLRNYGVNDFRNGHTGFFIADTLIHKECIDCDNYYFNKMSRCRAVLFDSITNSLLISFTDGLQKIQDNRLTPVLYKGQPLYVSSMVRYNRKIYAATFNNGLFIIDSNSVNKVFDDTESPLDAIVRIKRCNDHIWLFRTHDIQVLDAKRDKFISIYPFPVDAPNITDVEEDSSNIYLATQAGLYTLPTSEGIKITKADPSFLYMLVNNTDTVYKNDITLPFYKNNLLFRLAIPIYKNADQLHFKYRLLNSDIDSTSKTNATWYYTQDAQRNIQFNALKPGKYTMEIIAIKENEIISYNPLVYNFTILGPWYSTWWFYALTIIFMGAFFLTIYQYRLRQVFKIERVRRKISNDLHDDIGSTLSSINVYSQLARKDKDNFEYIDTIQTNTVSIINSLDDLVWNINPKNDLLEHLINRMQLFALPLFSEKDIDCIFKIKTDNPHTPIAPNVRADIYLLFKEIVNNVIKHSACTICSIYIIQKGRMLRLTVKDNGRGFNRKNTTPHRNGLRILGERVKDVKGTVIINSAPGQGTEIRIKCRIK